MRRLRKTLLVLASFAGGLVVLTLLTSKTYRVVSSAMEPTFHCARHGAGCGAGRSDRVLVSRVLYRLRDPKRGDLVAFRIPSQGAALCASSEGAVFIKRVLVLPGERWSEERGFIHVNGEQLREPYVEAERRDQDSLPEKTVPNGQYVLIGDNRSSSCDSRRIGPVPRKNLIGPVFAVYWPPKRIGFR
jgi:signal peptidase I